MKSPQFWSVVLLMVGTLFLMHVRGDVDRVPVSTPLDQLPESIGSWNGQDLPLNAATLEVLGKGDFLNRAYTPNKSATTALIASRRIAAPVQLFIG